ncbi:hypothetical protein IWX49DRAFT_110418 [Phyllosticta citricarpa]|uniref:Secreted protein n=2 Tax=Phyllosticta TaxID=121621 RepID=A0ABR1ME88_9PEZI
MPRFRWLAFAHAFLSWLRLMACGWGGMQLVACSLDQSHPPFFPGFFCFLSLPCQFVLLRHYSTTTLLPLDDTTTQIHHINHPTTLPLLATNKPQTTNFTFFSNKPLDFLLLFFVPSSTSQSRTTQFCRFWLASPFPSFFSLNIQCVHGVQPRLHQMPVVCCPSGFLRAKNKR